jgi:hypothetical protein
MKSAIEAGTDVLEDHAFARATDPEKPSDILTIFLLKARRPEKFKDTYRQEVVVTDGSAANAHLSSLIEGIRRNQIAALEALQIARRNATDATIIEPETK